MIFVFAFYYNPSILNFVPPFVKEEKPIFLFSPIQRPAHPRFWKPDIQANRYAMRLKVGEAAVISCDTAEQILKLRQHAYDQYVIREPQNQVKLLKIVASNFIWDGENVEMSHRKPFDMTVDSKMRKWLPGRDSNPRPSG